MATYATKGDGWIAPLPADDMTRDSHGRIVELASNPLVNTTSVTVVEAMSIDSNAYTLSNKQITTKKVSVAQMPARHTQDRYAGRMLNTRERER